MLATFFILFYMRIETELPAILALRGVFMFVLGSSLGFCIQTASYCSVEKAKCFVFMKNGTKKN